MSSDRFFQGQPIPPSDQNLSVVAGKSPSGTALALSVDALGGQLGSVLNNPTILAATGYPGLDGAQVGGYPDAIKIQLRGTNNAVGASLETLWAIGSGTYAHSLVAVPMEVLSNDANDTSAGTGARTVRVQGIDTNDAIVNETVTLNGVTPVAMVTSLKTINNIYVLTAGSGLKNAGNIDVRVVSGSVQKMRISTVANVSLSKSQDFVYTIPTGYIGILKSIFFSATGATGDITVVLVSTTSTGVTAGEGTGRASMSNTAFNPGQGRIDFGSGLYLPAKTNINLQAIAGAGSASITANAELILLKQGSIPSIA